MQPSIWMVDCEAEGEGTDPALLCNTLTVASVSGSSQKEWIIRHSPGSAPIFQHLGPHVPPQVECIPNLWFCISGHCTQNALPRRLSMLVHLLEV